MLQRLLALVGLALVCLLAQGVSGQEPTPKPKVIITDDIDAVYRQTIAVLKIRHAQEAQVEKVRDLFKTDRKAALKLLRAEVSAKNYKAARLLAGLHWEGNEEAGVAKDMKEALAILQKMEHWPQTGLELDELQGLIKEAEKRLKK